MTCGWHPRTLGWAQWKVKVAYLRLLWTIAAELNIEHQFGIKPNRRAS